MANYGEFPLLQPFKPTDDVHVAVLHRSRERSSRWQSPLLAALVLLVGSSIPLPIRHNPDTGLLGPDKALHAIGHMAFTASLIPAFEAADRNPTIHAVVVAIGISSAYGVGTELLQERIPGREFEVGDVIAGIFGSVCGGLWWYW